MRIEDGGGMNGFVKVTANQQLRTFAVTETEQASSVDEGGAFNINTGLIPLTGTSSNALLYFKNDESVDFVVTGIVVGVGVRTAAITDLPVITIVRNPTAGTLVAAVTAADIKSNANFGSSVAFATTTLAYKATASGQTLTGGTDHAIVYGAEGRTNLPLDISIPRGSAIGITVDLNTSGGANAYAVIIGYKKSAFLS